MERSINISRSTMTKLHILSVSRGSWDDYHRINIGVFDSEEKANEVGDRFLSRVKELGELMDSECPIEESMRVRYEEECDFDLFESLPEEDQGAYHEWRYKKNMITEINNEYKVEPYILNESDFSEFTEIFPS